MLSMLFSFVCIEQIRLGIYTFNLYFVNLRWRTIFNEEQGNTNTEAADQEQAAVFKVTTYSEPHPIKWILFVYVYRDYVLG